MVECSATLENGACAYNVNEKQHIILCNTFTPQIKGIPEDT